MRAELVFYRDTRNSETAYHADLFKLNKITHEDRIINLCVLLGRQSDQKMFTTIQYRGICDFERSGTVEVSTTQANTEVNKIYVTLWLPHYGWKKINTHGTLDTAFGERIMGLTKENIFIECKIIKFGT